MLFNSIEKHVRIEKAADALRASAAWVLFTRIVGAINY